MLDKELIKEIITMFLDNEAETYKIIKEMNVRPEVTEESNKRIKIINILKEHIAENYESILEAICEELNKKKETKKQKIDKK